jgi:hypothetical protein
MMGDMQEKVLWMLDQLKEISKDNWRKGSNFAHALEYAYNATCGTGAHYFVFQANEGLVGEEIFMEKAPKTEGGGQAVPAPRNPYETCNKSLFDRFAARTFHNTNTFTFFIFGKHYKVLCFAT